MGILFSWLQQSFAQRTANVICIGLDGVGKTTILYHMLGEGDASSKPTIGFNVERIQVGRMCLQTWDLGGQTTLRRFWKNAKIA